MADQLNSLPPELQVEFDQVKRRQQLADTLMSRGMQPLQSATVNGRPTPISPLNVLAQLVNVGVGSRMRGQNEGAYKELGDKYNAGLADAVKEYSATRGGRPEIASPPDEIGGGPGREAIPGDPKAAIVKALTSSYAPVRELGKLDFQHQGKQEDIAAAGEQARLTRAQTDLARGEQQQAERTARADRLTQQLTATGIQNDHKATLLKELAGIKRETEVYKADAKTKQNNPNAKPIPAPALKMQSEALDAIGNAESINSDLQQVRSQLSSGQLNLGLFRNLYNQGRTYAGWSTPEGVKLQSFKNQLEKLRNDSLRLNKGVQTEGDSVRAFNEILSNVNDKNYVMDRLAEVERINQRGVELHKAGVNMIRSNYSHEPLDFSSWTAQPGAMGGSTGQPSVPAVAPNARPNSFGAPPPGSVTRIQ